MEPNKIINTYQDTLKNDAILGDMYHVLNKMGISVGKKRKDILDTFLTNRRYFDTNIISTVATGNTGYGYYYDFSVFYGPDAVAGSGVILPSYEPSVFELKNPNENIKGIVR